MADLNPLVTGVGANYPFGAKPVMASDRQGAAMVSEAHGKWYNQTLSGNVFSGTVAAVTVPVNAAALVSVFSLFNPANSSVNLELISFDIVSVLATTVVDGVGLYFQKIGGATTIPTSQTAGTVTNGILGNSANPQGIFLSAATHVGTPTLVEILTGFGAVTTSAFNPNHVDFDGRIIIPPNVIVSVAMTTAASTASGITMGIRWAEVPRPV